MKSDRVVPVAIVGGGASGTILAAQLARRGIGSALIDGSGRVGKGVAYSTTEPAHLLNVRAEGMSAWAGEPDHFAKRFEAEGGDPRGFAQRRLFRALPWRDPRRGGRQRTRRSSSRRPQSGATREDGGWQVELDDGATAEARALVLGDRQPGAGSAARVRRSRASASSAIRGATRPRRGRASWLQAVARRCWSARA